MSDLKHWMTGTALPFWSTAGFDRDRGRFHERLDLQGRPLDVPYRSMLQARQIYVFAHAAHLGWFPEGADLAETAMQSLRRDFETTIGGRSGFAFSIRPDGQVVSEVRDAYAHAFVLFAAAWLYRVNGDARLLTLADGVLAFMDEHLADARHGGYDDQNPIADGTKRQNPHMHLLEALLALEAAAPGRGYLERAGTLIGLFKLRLFDARHGVLLEYFAPDWSDHPDAQKRHLFEPGHHFEWVWLLREYERSAGADLGTFRRRLDSRAMQDGFANGLIVDEVAAGGGVLKSSHRIWPHTEAIKAAAVRHAEGDATAAAFAQSMWQALKGVFLDRPFAGGWIDHVDAAKQPLVGYVPASSLYHLMLAATEAPK